MGPLVGLTTLSIFATGRLPDWASMWLMAISLYGGFKWLTWQRAVREETPSLPPAGRSLAYLLLWPGMNARRFLWGAEPPRPATGDWLRAARNVAAGAAIFWLLAWQ